MKNNHRLAVVIPAHKGAYWREALESLAAQTDHRFTVYVGDDAGEPAIAEVSDSFMNRLNIVYHRFEKNLGGTDLVAHWNRCVALSSEDWVWLFSDDDRCDPDIVAAFYRALENESFDVYRFATSTIGATGDILRANPTASGHETGCSFALSRISGGRRSFVVEYIFSRTAYDREGGFVNFPNAWFADDASWLAFSRHTGIQLIPGPQIFWRYSGTNISSRIEPSLAEEKANALFLFHDWLQKYLQTAEKVQPEILSAIRNKTPRWIYHQLGVAGCYRRLDLALSQTKPVSKALGISRLAAGTNLIARSIKSILRSNLKPLPPQP